jgi:hypothetical protein
VAVFNTAVFVWKKIEFYRQYTQSMKIENDSISDEAGTGVQMSSPGHLPSSESSSSMVDNPLQG